MARPSSIDQVGTITDLRTNTNAASRTPERYEADQTSSSGRYDTNNLPCHVSEIEQSILQVRRRVEVVGYIERTARCVLFALVSEKPQYLLNNAA